MIVNLDENAFSEYVVYSLKAKDDRVHGLRFLKSSAIECSIIIADLEIAGIVAINPKLVEKVDVNEHNREFLCKFFKKKGVTGVYIPDFFKNVGSFSDFFKLCAEQAAFVTIEGLGEDEFEVLEFSIDDNTGSLDCREIYADGEVENEWSEFNLTTAVAKAEVFEPYINNLQEYVRGVPAQKLKLIK